MEIFKKLNDSRKLIKQSNLKKEGHNDYSNYDYYTPEQVDKLVHDACDSIGILDIFHLKKNEFGYYGELILLNIENPEDKIMFTQSTDIPVIKATNVAQQIGGAVTYTKRYMLMTAFDIVDNNLDFDASNKDNSSTPRPKEKLKVDAWMSASQFESAKDLSKEYLSAIINKYNGKPHYKDGKVYAMKKDYKTELTNILKTK